MVKFILRKYPVIYSFWCDFKWDSFFFFSLLPSYLTPHVSFLQPWLYRSLSADFQLVFSKNCSTCGGTFNIFMRRWVLYPPTLVILIYLLCVCVCVCVSVCVLYIWCSVARLYPTLCDSMNGNPPDSSVHGIFPGKNVRMDCHFLLQRIFLTQGSNPCPLH